jgi:hypothetical protein
MDSPPTRCHRIRCPIRALTCHHVSCIREISVLDVIYVIATLALFALVALIAKGVEKLAPPAGGAPRPAASDDEVRR